MWKYGSAAHCFECSRNNEKVGKTSNASKRQHVIVDIFFKQGELIFLEDL